MKACVALHNSLCSTDAANTSNIHYIPPRCSDSFTPAPASVYGRWWTVVEGQQLLGHRTARQRATNSVCSLGKTGLHIILYVTSFCPSAGLCASKRDFGLKANINTAIQCFDRLYWVFVIVIFGNEFVL